MATSTMSISASCSAIEGVWNAHKVAGVAYALVTANMHTYEPPHTC